MTQTLKTYDPNISWGTHRVKVTLQQWDYKGQIILAVGGNCRGFSILECSTDIDESSILDMDCNFRYLDAEEEIFHCELKNPNGDILEIDEPIEDLSRIIVGVEIIDFSKN